MFQNYSSILPREDISIIVMLVLSLVFIGYVVYLFCLCYKTEKPVIERCDFSEKYNLILNKIGEMKDLQSLDDLKLYAVTFITDEDFQDSNNLGLISMLNEHFKLREMELTGNIEEGNFIADSILQRLKHKAAYNEALRSYN